MPAVVTDRLTVHVRERKPAGAGGPRVLLVHGNASSGVFYEPLMAALPADYHVLVPDLRGYGDTESLALDATRGLRDFSDDLWSLLQTVGWTRDVHAVGWSLGGGVVSQFAIDHPEVLASLTLIAPVSPYGFGGTHGEDGTPNTPDFAGSGGGTVNPAFVAAVAAGDRGDAPGSPRDVMRQFYFHTWRPDPEQEEVFLDGLLSTRTGENNYPGDFVASANWPGTAPGTRGLANAFSPKYHDTSALADITPRVPILWVRGEHDRIVSDTSSFDLAVLGQVGLVPGWPGPDACPPQPMVAQTRAVLERYRAAGGTYREVVLRESGHSPLLEEQEAFVDAFTAHVASATRETT